MTNSTFSTPASAALRAGELEHLVGHVEPDRLAGGRDAAGGDQHVGAGARAEIEHGLAVVQSSATAVGTPQPSEAFTASSGTLLAACLVVERGAEHAGLVRRAAAVELV